MVHSIQFFFSLTSSTNHVYSFNKYLRYVFTYVQTSPFIYMSVNRIYNLQITVTYSKCCSPLFFKPLETLVPFTMFKNENNRGRKSYLVFHFLFPTDVLFLRVKNIPLLFFFSLPKIALPTPSPC